MTFEPQPAISATNSSPVSALRVVDIKMAYPAMSLVLKTLNNQSRGVQQSSAIHKRIESLAAVVWQSLQINSIYYFTTHLSGPIRTTVCIDMDSRLTLQLTDIKF